MCGGIMRFKNYKTPYSLVNQIGECKNKNKTKYSAQLFYVVFSGKHLAHAL